MEVSAAIRTRLSEHRLLDPAPGDHELARLIEWAAHAPDHGRLRPWRLISIRGHARTALGESLALEAEEEATDRVRRLPLRAPLLVTIVFRPRPSHKIPTWEQLAATTGVVNNLMLLLHDRGYGSIWRTGEYTRCSAAKAVLDLHEQESLLGWLYVGTPDPAVVGRRTAPPPAHEHLSSFQPARCLGEIRRTRQGLLGDRMA